MQLRNLNIVIEYAQIYLSQYRHFSTVCAVTHIKDYNLKTGPCRAVIPIILQTYNLTYRIHFQQEHTDDQIVTYLWDSAFW